jgi:hypothetical protein
LIAGRKCTGSSTAQRQWWWGTSQVFLGAAPRCLRRASHRAFLRGRPGELARTNSTQVEERREPACFSTCDSKICNKNYAFRHARTRTVFFLVFFIFVFNLNSNTRHYSASTSLRLSISTLLTDFPLSGAMHAQIEDALCRQPLGNAT